MIGRRTLHLCPSREAATSGSAPRVGVVQDEEFFDRQFKKLLEGLRVFYREGR